MVLDLFNHRFFVRTVCLLARRQGTVRQRRVRLDLHGGFVGVEVEDEFFAGGSEGEQLLRRNVEG